MDKILYHYCNTQKMYGIMSGRQIKNEKAAVLLDEFRIH